MVFWLLTKLKATLNKGLGRLCDANNTRIRGALGVMIIVQENRHSDTSSNNGQGCLHFTFYNLDRATSLGERKF